jgi:exopolyphosphatase / guanosine-5'-triphosphate,3'-diphosphate pyrophosphatase
MRLAAIDIGSNSIHLVVVDADTDGQLNIITQEKDMVRLGAGAMMAHTLLADRMSMALATIGRYVKFAQGRGAEKILITATSAVREANNRREFLQAVYQTTGLDVEILTGVEEARLIAMSVAQRMNLAGQRALIIDIGGGSTEFIVTNKEGEPELLLSMKIGAVRLAEMTYFSDPIKKKELGRFRNYLRAALAHTAQEIKSVGFDLVIGTSGTALNLVSLAAKKFSTAPLSTGHLNADFTTTSYQCTLAQLTTANEHLARLSEKDRTHIPELDPRRADIIIAGGQLLEAILQEVGATTITTCDWALREGVLLNYLAAHRQHSHADLGIPSLPPTALDVRDKAILAFARRYEYEPKHAHQVARLVGKLFDGLEKLHKLAPEDRVLLQYAALLHDIGYHIAHARHHKHGYYLIQHAELPGFSIPEVALIANLVRFHRGATPQKKKHPEYAALPKSIRRKLQRMLVLLRLADDFDRSHQSLVRDLQVRQTPQGWEIELLAIDNLEVELWYGRQVVDYCHQVFKQPITILRGGTTRTNSADFFPNSANTDPSTLDTTLTALATNPPNHDLVGAH